VNREIITNCMEGVIVTTACVLWLWALYLIPDSSTLFVFGLIVISIWIDSCGFV